jgi:hypothetical protein
MDENATYWDFGSFPRIMTVIPLLRIQIRLQLDVVLRDSARELMSFQQGVHVKSDIAVSEDKVLGDGIDFVDKL